jgi:hypothetical protein
MVGCWSAVGYNIRSQFCCFVLLGLNAFDDVVLWCKGHDLICLMWGLLLTLQAI